MTSNVIKHKYNKLELFKKYTIDNVKKSKNILCFNSTQSDIPVFFLRNISLKNNTKIYIINEWQYKVINKFQRSIFNNEMLDYHEIIKKEDKNNNIIFFEELDYLNYLSNLNIFFDYIYVDCSENYYKLFRNILYFMSLLNDDGIIIFDNYQLYNLDDKIKQYKTPSINLKTIFHLFNDQIKVLFKEDIFIIKKKNSNSLFYKIREIKTFLYYKKLDISNNNKIKFNLKLSNKGNDFLEKYGADENVTKITKIVHSDEFNECSNF